MSIQHGDPQLIDQNALVRAPTYIYFFSIVFSVLGAVAILGLLMVMSRYGLDFTDEGFYLAWGSKPGLYDWSLSQFGFIYHPLYLLFGGDIALIRKVNVLMVFGLSWMLVFTLLKGVFDEDLKGKIQHLAFAFGFASGSLVFFSAWLPTPSYNSLNLQALLIAATGLAAAQSKISKESILGWALIAIGGWLAFMAKPSSAAVLGGGAFLYILLARKFNFRLAVFCGALTLLLLVFSAFLIDGSVQDFIRRLQVAMKFSDYLGGGYSVSNLIRVDDFVLNQQDITLFFSALLISLVAALLMDSGRRALNILGVVCAGIVVLLILLLVSFRILATLDNGGFHNLLMLSIPASMILFSIGLYRHRFFLHVPISRWSIGVMFTIFPHVYAFGTNNNYWQVGGLAGFFWLLGGLVLVAPVISKAKAGYALLPFLLATQLIVVLLLLTGMESPYRQPEPLRLNTHTVEIGQGGSGLVLSQGYATYLTAAMTASRKVGFQPGTPVIDLTGQSPSVLFAIGATNIGQAWMIGGYPGSFKMASEALKRVPCDQLAAAWLLTEPEGPRSLSVSLVSSFGAELSDYEVVASWNTAKGAGGYEQRPAQQLLKPVRNSNTSIKACSDSRN
ncbi:hypothetical protein [Pseudomonas sp. ACM7]|uniref:hypothetical protein n=1 Tax=Pseudomonas sp. ACM7 TaxID=2052956 RepID=UPI001010AE0A|nr:hypothetical protein [Pseudomonas sp. ACM7]QAY92456.1 hypothetical protein CUN63_22210 [Pseudomonas sp. ACM7]